MVYTHSHLTTLFQKDDISSSVWGYALLSHGAQAYSGVFLLCFRDLTPSQWPSTLPTQASFLRFQSLGWRWTTCQGEALRVSNSAPAPVSGGGTTIYPRSPPYSPGLPLSLSLLHPHTPCQTQARVSSAFHLSPPTATKESRPPPECMRVHAVAYKVFLTSVQPPSALLQTLQL